MSKNLAAKSFTIPAWRTGLFLPRSSATVPPAIVGVSRFLKTIVAGVQLLITLSSAISPLLVVPGVNLWAVEPVPIAPAWPIPWLAAVKESNTLNASTGPLAADTFLRLFNVGFRLSGHGFEITLAPWPGSRSARLSALLLLERARQSRGLPVWCFSLQGDAPSGGPSPHGSSPPRSRSRTRNAYSGGDSSTATKTSVPRPSVSARV